MTLGRNRDLPPTFPALRVLMQTLARPPLDLTAAQPRIPMSTEY